MKKKILIAEDDVSILTGLTDLLTSEGFTVVTATDGRAALERYKKEKPHLILLDIMIPGQSGYDVCRSIRREDTEIPILMLTAKGEEIDKVVGLEIGADDYIVKPFGVKELLARIRAVLRRTESSPRKTSDLRSIQFGDVTIDCRTMIGQKKGKSFVVSLREIELLKVFLDHENEVLDRNTLLDRVWGVQYEGTTRTLDQHIAKLRQKIETDPAKPVHIQTVHSVGYRFVNTPDG